MAVAKQTTPRAQPLDTLAFPLWGSRLIEASAGTGKTYTIASLYLRMVLGHGESAERRPLTPPDILVVTFTRAATQELRDRIRMRLTQAAACFLEDVEGDEFLQRLRADYPPERWSACARLLQLAADWMDDAAISTIDAWCYRMLREHAFDSASLFDVDMDVDALQAVAEATRDYWRIFIAPLSANDLSRVLQAIAAQLTDKRMGVDCDSLAAILHRKWLAYAHEYGAPPGPAEILQQLQQRSQACKAQWRSWVPQIRDLLQDAHAAGHYHKGKLRANSLAGWLAKLESWAEDPDSKMPFEPSVAAWSRLTPEGLAAVWKEGDPPDHPAFRAMVTLRDEIQDLDDQAARIFPHAAVWVAQRVAELRSQRAMLDFSGLLQQLHDALSGANGERLAQRIRTQFPAALIDEFQDTNPLQYEIFDRIYRVEENSNAALLALIGDPKQAIYRFRGADIHAYLAARRACAGRLYTLGNNYRSSAAMVAAVNHLFSTAEHFRERGAFLFRRPQADEHVFDDPVPFHPVKAAAAPGDWLIDGVPGKALTIWCDPAQDRRGACADAVANACAAEIFRLLRLGSERRAGFQRNGDFMPLQARDIAVLVNNRNEAAGLRAELARLGIRSVYMSDDSSVFQSPAARDMLAWLRACAEPENGGFVRAALATASLGLSWQRLDTFVRDEFAWEAMLERFSDYKEQWRRRGVLSMLRRFMHEFGVPARLFAEQRTHNSEGERQLTDLLHLAELLQAASVRHDGEHAIIRYLEECINAGGMADLDGDASRMRLESDAGLVQVVTVHKSKGLEYPLVFYPYAYHARAVTSLELPALYRDQDGRACVLANAADADEATRAAVAESLEHERLAEDLRKLYVALTRARHATWMALAPVDTLGVSASGYLLGGPPACTAQTLVSSLENLSRSCPELAIEPFPAPQEGRLAVSDDSELPLAWRQMRRRIEQRWSLSSYSALARLAMEPSETAAAVHPDIDALALPDEARRDAFIEAYLSEAAPAGVDESGPAAAASGRSADPAGIHAFPRGAAPGSFLHGLLEWLFSQGPRRVLAAPDQLLSFVERRCRSRGWEAHAEPLAQWLASFFTQAYRIALPEQGVQANLVLADLATVLPEMEFWFGVQEADLPMLDALVSRHFLSGHPRSTIGRGRLNGMLRGFVDLVFEHDGRYYVADYKSNWLGPDDHAYDAAAITRAMLDHRYDLQAAIYLYALHRLLQSRLGARYDYKRHVGAALVFFMRGCGAAGQGLHIERPSLEVMLRLESVFGGMENEVKK